MTTGQMAQISERIDGPVVMPCRFKCGFELVDEDGRPVASVTLRIRHPNGDIVEHASGGDGRITFDLGRHESYAGVCLGPASAERMTIVESTQRPRTA